MGTIFMKSGNIKTCDSYRLLLNLSDKKKKQIKTSKYIALSNLSIYYTWKNIKKSYENNKFKIFRRGLKGMNYLMDDIIYQIFKIIFCIWLTILSKKWLIILNRIKVPVFFGKNIEKRHLCRHDQNYYYLWKPIFL